MDRPGALRALFVCYHYPPLSTTGSLRVARFVKYMPADIEVEVLTVANPPERRENLALAAELEGRARVHAAPLLRWQHFGAAEERLRRHGTGLVRRTLLKAGKTLLTWLVWIPDRQIAWRRHAREVGLALLAERRCDVVFSTSPPHSQHLLACDLARASDLPLVVDFRDPWSDNPQRHWASPLHRAWERRLERGVLRQAAVVLANTPGNRERLLQANPGLSPDAVIALPNGFDPARRAALRQAAPARDGRVLLLYTGHLYEGGDSFLHALARLVASDPALPRRLVVRVVGSLDPAIARAAEPLVAAGLVELHGRLPADRVPAEIAAADALLYVVPPHGTRWVPSKLYDYLLAGKPVLAVLPRGDAWSILEGSGLGVLIEDQGVAAVTTGLAAALDRLLAGTLRVEPRPAFIERFDGRAQAQELAAIFRRLARR